MKTTNAQIIKTLEIMKGKKVSNVDFANGTFECGKSAFSFELTKTGLIKANSVKFLWLIETYENTSY